MVEKLERILVHKATIHLMVLVAELNIIGTLWRFFFRFWPDDAIIIAWAILFVCFIAMASANKAIVNWLKVLPQTWAKRKKKRRKIHEARRKAKHGGEAHSSHADTQSSSVSHHSG